ncbi:MAG: aldehyde ferredoxin oxidoreductase family protein [Deltaproteobacteria bacterium]|jgi:aldehyde:ferredoxin oxidoreductase|nr:aldehyde ferredoxin oxidoreductase family protein [Deltaproteobacteria bacterium]MBT6501628.1 aldehyde ferredoxin oxidoreductase family protein [Deltaproteobacteria bacterium]MBT7714347.1 aldehyde ferredoxin oxidoreductase family protein [Deltaproteobacteria bacterium]
MNGYHGRILEVDLNTKTTSDLPISEAFYKKFLGGATLGAALIYDRVQPGLDPLGPESPLVFATGPFTGSAVPMVSRYAVCGISPQTGYWGEATSGGSFPFRLKDTGYDGIIITGKAAQPVYLLMNGGQVEIKEAGHLWGKDSYQTQELIKTELDEKALSVACIGEAGEKQIVYAGIMNDEGRTAGRTGMGAIMGSKNLKAVVVGGSQKVTTADKPKLRELAKTAVHEIRGGLTSLAFREYGTLFYTDMGMTLGDTPAQYFTKNVFEASKVTGESLRQNYAVTNYACKGCPTGCGREVNNFSAETPRVDGPEYETAIGFGPLVMNHDWDTIIRANHLCNVHGLDTISASVSIAYAFYLYDKGVLTKEQTGMELKWGDGEAVVKLVEMIIAQEGIGKLLSRGTLAMARELGRKDSEAAQVKGLEMPMHDGRAFQGLAVSYATGPRGACHLKGDFYNVELGAFIMELEILPGDRLSPENKAVYAAKYQSLKDLYDSLTMCKFSPISVTQICDMINAITGWDYDPAQLLAAGDRSMSIKRAISNKFGVTQAHDCLPDVCMQPHDEGATAGVEVGMDLMLKEYYEHRGWDPLTGKPTREKLLELSLDEVAVDLYG